MQFTFDLPPVGLILIVCIEPSSGQERFDLDHCVIGGASTFTHVLRAKGVSIVFLDQKVNIFGVQELPCLAPVWTLLGAEVYLSTFMSVLYSPGNADGIVSIYRGSTLLSSHLVLGEFRHFLCFD